MQKITLMSVLAVLCLNLRAQQPVLKSLSIGDTVPDITITNVYNYHPSAVRLSDLKDKLVILDFWATWCTACIREFPKLDSLQTHFKGSIKILLVSSKGSNNLKDISRFFEKHSNPGDEKYTFPYVANDTTLTKLFPHISIPHMVWLHNGKVIAITDGEEITADNLHRVLYHQAVHLDIKKDVMDFDPLQPLLANGNGGNDDALIRRSVFTKYLKGMNSRTGLSVNPDSRLQRYYVVNQPILKLYAIAMPQIAPNRVIIENTDMLRLIDKGNDKAWEKANYFSYEITLPASASISDIRNAMQQDLDRQFNLHSNIENRTVSCYALVQTGSTSVSAAKYEKDDNNDAYSNEVVWSFHNKPISFLCDVLNDQIPGDPLRPVVLNETNITIPVNFQLRLKDTHDLAAVKRALHPYGLDIIKVTRTIPMLVLSGADTSSKPNTIHSNSN